MERMQLNQKCHCRRHLGFKCTCHGLRQCGTSDGVEDEIFIAVNYELGIEVARRLDALSSGMGSTLLSLVQGNMEIFNALEN